MRASTKPNTLQQINNMTSPYESDRFIPRRLNGFKNNDSWNILDKFNHSPLSIMKNEKINYDDNDNNNNNDEYDECLQDILLSNNKLSRNNHIIPDIDRKYCKECNLIF